MVPQTAVQPESSDPSRPDGAGATGSAKSDDASSPPGPPPPAGVPSDSRVVLKTDEIARGLRRMAHEVLERNKGADDLVVLGIPTRGVALARRLASLMTEVEGRSIPVGALDITLYRDDLRRNPTRAPGALDIPPGGIDDKVVVLVDDVLYSGRTIRAALDALTDLGRPRTVRLAVLVDRGHRELPIRADVVGKNLPTSSSERVHVRLAEADGVDDEVRISRVGTTAGGKQS